MKFIIRKTISEPPFLHIKISAQTHFFPGQQSHSKNPHDASEINAIFDARLIRERR